MQTNLGEMDGNKWENHCQLLLRMHYEHDYQEVQDRVNGDLGIEGYTFSGKVFQCYCSDITPSGKELYEFQRDKITKDIKKLIKNAKKIKKLTKVNIKEWHFISPYYEDKELHKHARKKEKEVKDKNIDEIDDNFRIKLIDENYFIREENLLAGFNLNKIRPIVNEETKELITDIKEKNSKIFKVIEGKINKLNLTDKEKRRFANKLFSDYFEGKFELDRLNRDFPSIYLEIMDLKTGFEDKLLYKTFTSSSSSNELFNDIFKENEQVFAERFSGRLADSLVSSLLREAIADWLGKCSLDF